MSLHQLDHLLGKGRYADFFTKLPRVISFFSIQDRQNLLSYILEGHYKEEYAAEFRKAFDLIIGDDLDLDFLIEGYSPTLLAQVLYWAPSIPLFDYFLEKGANLNFVADAMYFYGDDPGSLADMPAGQFITCLDFADELVMYEMEEHGFELPEPRVEGSYLEVSSNCICLWQQEYLYLYQQARSFHRLINTLKLRAHIIKIGGKRQAELAVAAAA